MKLHFHTIENGSVLDFVFEPDGYVCTRVLNPDGVEIKDAPGIGSMLQGVIPTNHEHPEQAIPRPLAEYRWDELIGEQHRFVLINRAGERYLSAPIILVRREKIPSDRPADAMDTVSLPRPTTYPPSGGPSSSG